MDSYQVVFRGKLLSGFDEDTVVANLMALFKADAARMRALLQQPKVVLKSGVSREAGARYQEALRGAGIMVALVSESPSPAQPEVAAAVVATKDPAQSQVNASSAAAAARATLTMAEAGAVISEARTIAAPSIDTSALQLDAVGSVIDRTPRPAPAKTYDISHLSLDAVGAVIGEKAAVTPPQFDLSALSLAPVDPVQDSGEISDFWQRAERED